MSEIEFGDAHILFANPILRLTGFISLRNGLSYLNPEITHDGVFVASKKLPLGIVCFGIRRHSFSHFSHDLLTR